MTNIRKLIQKMAAAEVAFTETRFIAPRLPGGKVRAKVGGIVQTFPVEPEDFTGWGIFQAQDRQRKRVAVVVEEADLPLVGEYLKQFPLLRLRLVRQLVGQTWLAFPSSEADMRQRFGTARPVAVHLTMEGTVFEQITARNVGGNWWFEEVDRRADPMPVERMRDALEAVTIPETLAFSGLTPEMRTVYELVTQGDGRFAQHRMEEAEHQRLEQLRRAQEQYFQDQGEDWYIEAHRDELDEAWRAGEEAAPVLASEPQQNRGRQRRQRQQGRQGQSGTWEGNDAERLREALRVGGGQLQEYTDRGEYWLVEWRGSNGQRHTSAIAKADLTVISSGICLSGRDRDFDLQSLVGVIDQR